MFKELTAAETSTRRCCSRTAGHSTQKTWRKRACNEKIASRLHEVIFDEKVYRRNRKHLAASTEKIEEEVILPHKTSKLPRSPCLYPSPRQDNPVAKLCTTRLLNPVSLCPTLICQITLLIEDYLQDGC